jgi:hypothetical protein
MDLVFVILVAVYLSLMGLVVILDAKLGFFLKWKSNLETGHNASKWNESIQRLRTGFGVGGFTLFLAGLAVNIYAWTIKDIVHESTVIFWCQLGVIVFMSCFFVFEWLVRGGASKESTHESPAWAIAVCYALTIYMLALFIIDGGVSAQRFSSRQATAAQVHLESDALDRSGEQKRLMRDASAFWLWVGFAVGGDFLLPKRKKPESTFGRYSRTLEKL